MAEDETSQPQQNKPRFKPPYIRYLIKDLMANNVSNQKCEGICLAMAIADCMSIIIRQYIRDKYLIVSPQPLIDSGICLPRNMIDEEGNNVFQIPYKEIADFVCDSDNGLPSVISYPLVKMGRSNVEFKDTDYLCGDFTRYIINQLDPIFGRDAILVAHCENFNVDGLKHPVIGALDMGTLEQPEVARKHANPRNPPFRPSNDDMKIRKKTNQKRKRGQKGKKNENKIVVVVEEEECDHAVVILGIDTRSLDENEHFAWVKCTYGVKWGLDGITRVWLGCFKYILLPRYNHKDVVELIAKEKEYLKNQSKGRGSATRSTIPEQDDVDSRNKKPISSSVVSGLAPIGRQCSSSQASDRRGDSSNSSYTRYGNDDTSEDITRASIALENFQLDRTYCRHGGEDHM